MKKTKRKIGILLLLVILIGYWISFSIFGNKEQTVINQPVSTVATTRPRLEDDFYEYINYDYLSNDKLGEEEIQHFAIDQTEKIEEEKKIIIDELLTSKSVIGTKIKNFYKSYTENTEEKAIRELNKYIEKMNNSQNVEEFIKNAIDVNYELSTDILISPNILYNQMGKSEKYFGFDLITYDWDNKDGYYYSIEGHEAQARMYKKYNVQILKKYGYSSKEAIEIAEKVQSMYKEISRFSEISGNSYSLYKNGYKTYKISELQSMFNNIPLNTIINYYSEFCKKNDEIIVVDINQMKMVDSYLKEENLEILKNYATLKILTTYSKCISEEYYKIYYDYMCESNNYIDDETYTTEEIGYAQIYTFFKDTITEKFAEKHFTKEQKEFYTNLVKEEIEAYKVRIQNEAWLSDETKQKAIAKMENMVYTVGVPEEFVKVENKYEIDSDNSYISNVINMQKNIKKEEMRQYKKDNIFYNTEYGDQLTVNAFYAMNNNSMNLLLGYIYSLTESFDFGQDNLEQNYYKILGSIGATIGHELSHALDTTGSKFDKYGNYINWWTKDDEYNFNTLIGKVVKYYEKYEQYGDTTIGENIADLGGVSIILQIAESKNATHQDYKDLFEAYAMDWASQCTSICKEYLLKEDEHSPNKNRANAVLSTFDKFYEVYNIKDTDKMYVRSEDRVAVW